MVRTMMVPMRWRWRCGKQLQFFLESKAVQPIILSKGSNEMVQSLATQGATINPVDAIGHGANISGGMASTGDDGQRVIDIEHPEYTAMKSDWEKFKLTYAGGREFLNAFLKQYSKAEEASDYEARKAISYVPAYAKRVINVIRNSMAVKMPDVNREGDPIYIEAMSANVDTFKSSMSAFIALEIVPLLLAQGKRFIIVDAPPAAPEGATLAEDSGSAFIYAVDADAVQSWNYSEDGKLLTALVSSMQTIIDDATGLVSGTAQVYKLYRLGIFDQGDSVTAIQGVQVTTYNSDSRIIDEQFMQGLTRLPIVEFSLADSLLTDIADMQIALMNLSSTDMSFLYRSNFPIYVEQQEPGRMSLKPLASSKRKNSNNPSEQIDTGFDDELTRTKGGRAMGNGRGRTYMKGLEKPGFITPPSSNISISMEKQDKLITDITVMADLALTSLSVKALEQSGKSKEADRVGEEAGLSHIATVLEGGEREVALIFHEFLGSSTASAVDYPTGYTIRTNAERMEEAATLAAIRSTVNSPTFYKCVSKRIAEIALKQVCTTGEIAAIELEIEQRPYTDENPDRAKMIQDDVTARILDKGGAAELRGYADDTQVKVAVEQEIEAQSIMGVPLGVDKEEDDDLEDDQTGLGNIAG